MADSTAYQEYRRSSTAPKFFFSSADHSKFQSLFVQWDSENSPVAEADATLSGRFRFYSQTEKEVGCPPNWFKNQFTGEIALADRHWSELGDFGFGDIKNIWELSRFGWAYTFVRAYWRTGDEKYPEAFWALFEDWMEKNPPNVGVHWKCGQEISFRLMAWCFALYGFLESRATTADRLQRLLKAVAVSAERIQSNISYAISQKNNHGISEGMGLWTIGIIFPELNGAGEWRKTGEKALERLGRELIYEDGSFSQHSMNYHRVMLHDYIWAIRLGELNQAPLSEELRQRVAAAAEFLWKCQDERTGFVPLYGPNDGALILPLTNCDYRDCRPVVAAGKFLVERQRVFSAGVWDEASLWLFGAEALELEPSLSVRPGCFLSPTGYLVMRGCESWVFSRASGFRHRPNEADSLHVDLWWEGMNIAGDAGTFSYNAPPPWDGALKRTGCHNTLCIDGLDQMEKVGRFLWLPWPKGGWRSPVRQEGNELLVEGFHNGYERLSDPVLHRRAILNLDADTWVIVDRAESKGEHTVELHWLLANVPAVRLGDGSYRLDTPSGRYHLAMAVEGGGEFALVTGDSASPRGWRSSYYQARENAPSLTLRRKGKGATFISVFSPHEVSITPSSDGWELELPTRRIQISLGRGPGASLVANWEVYQNAVLK